MPVATTYEDPRAHAVRERYLALFGGEGLPVPVEAIADDLLGLRIEESWDIDCSGMLLPAERKIVLNAHERVGGRNDPPLRRFRFTIAHEIGHWVMHRGQQTLFCRSKEVQPDDEEVEGPDIEEEASIFAASLLMPRDLMQRYWERVGKNHGVMCEVFDCSGAAMGRRLHTAL